MIDYAKLYESRAPTTVELDEEQMLNFCSAMDIDPMNIIEPEPTPLPKSVVGNPETMMLASRIRELTGALRRALTANIRHSDQGRASWYSDGMRVLQRMR